MFSRVKPRNVQSSRLGKSSQYTILHSFNRDCISQFLNVQLSNLTLVINVAKFTFSKLHLVKLQLSIDEVMSRFVNRQCEKIKFVTMPSPSTGRLLITSSKILIRFIVSCCLIVINTQIYDYLTT